ncbi:MAG TPA: hypothetical protein VFV47_06940 [Hyphomicrobiaceae bacterium]|jgi:hypothetical protein|nr:hypothetical protein [Hyphomicrobiaceae bacterium]
MSDAAGFGEVLATARLLREIDPGECQRRNALTNKRADLRLRQGSVVTVLESLDQGNAFLVEFGEKREGCDWLGVLYPAEIEFESAQR